MTIDAIFRDLLSHLDEHTALVRLMTAQASLGQFGHTSLFLVNIMAGRAGQIAAGSKALAKAQQSNLVSVDIGPRIHLGLRREILFQVFSRLVGKRGPSRLADTRMAEGAVIDASGAAEGSRVEDVFRGCFLRLAALILRMPGARAVALFAGNTQQVLARI